MKSKILRCLLVAGLIVCIALLAACGTTDKPAETKANNNSQSTGDGPVLSFVAADKTDWDLEVAIDGLNYKFAVELNADNTVSVKATCTGRVQAQSNQGGMGGSGAQEETQPVETEAPLTEAEMRAQDFTVSGTWTYEKGYGYTITLPNGTVKTDFDKASSRTYFYSEIEKDGVKSPLTQFQAKDSNFRKEIAADYEDYEVREAEYIFEITVQQNNNPNSTHLYLEKDGVANSLVYQGSSPTYKRGAWNIDPEDDLLTVYIEDEMIKGDYCDVAGKEGWRIKYNSNTMYSRDDVEYTDVDFEGAVVKELPSANGASLKLTEKGFAKLVDGEDVYTGKYTEDNGVMTVTIDGHECVSENGSITVSIEKSTGSGGAGGTTETVNYAFNLDGSVPEAQPAEGGEGEGGSGGEGQPAEGGETGEGQPAEGGEGEGASGGEGGSGGEGENPPETEANGG